MSFILQDGKRFELLAFDTEDDFEKEVIAHSSQLFGSHTIYIDKKKLIGRRGKWGGGIPDGFLLDLTDPTDPDLYFVENELASHDVYKHIAEQIARFLSAAEMDTVEIRNELIKYIRSNETIHNEILQLLKNSQFHNIDQLFNTVVEKPIRMVVVIDEETTDLNHVLSVFKLKPDTAILRRYVHGSETVYFCEPMREELLDIDNSKSDTVKMKREYDTIICPAFGEGFHTAFIEQNAWWAIRMSQEARERIKYLAIYESKPEAAINYYAEVERIEEYNKSGKFKIYLKNRKKIKPIKLDSGGKRGIAPQGPRFSTLSKLLKAKKISDLW